MKDHNKSHKFPEVNANLMLSIGVFLRIFYVLAGQVAESRQYDIGPIVQQENRLTGHLGYIYYLNIYKHFTDFDPREIYQFPHPPLHHIIEALWMGIAKLFTNDQVIIAEWLQIPTCVYSIILLFAVLGIIKELGLGKVAGTAIMAVTAFHPNLIFMAGSINNDGLSFMFQFLAIYLTIKWINQISSGCNKSSLKTLIWLALAISLGMLAKLSTALIAVPVAFVFLYAFIKAWKDSKAFPGKLFGHFVIFGLICIPIGLCWSIRCYIRFNMPMNYIYELPKDSWQYIGDHSLMERFFIPNPVTLISNLSHGSIGLGENMWIQLFRTAALGECDLSDFSLIAKLLLMLMMAVNIVVAGIAFIYFIKNIISLKKDFSSNTFVHKAFFLSVYVVIFASYVSFCYKYPHECTMNFRYIVPTILIPAIAWGEGLDLATKTKRAWISHLALVAYIICSIITTFIWSFY